MGDAPIWAIVETVSVPSKLMSCKNTCRYWASSQYSGDVPAAQGGLHLIRFLLSKQHKCSQFQIDTQSMNNNGLGWRAKAKFIEKKKDQGTTTGGVSGPF